MNSPLLPPSPERAVPPGDGTVWSLTSGSVTFRQARARRARAFVRRVYPMRNLGLLLLALPYLSELYEQAESWLYWLLAGLNILVWPHVAFLWARSAPDPVAAEFRNLLIDVAFGVFWIVVSEVSLVPAAVMIGMLASDRLAAGGWLLLGRAVLVGVVCYVLYAALLGWPFQPVTSNRTTWLAMPSVVAYMVALSHVNYRLTRRISSQNRELDRLNLTDPGVDLPNRRFFNLRAGELLATARSHGGEVALLLVDVDDFKSINDNHGHLAGDEVLREIARLLREQAGAGGLPARVGGDEFTLLLPGALADGQAAASELRGAVAGLELSRWPGLRVGVSIGVAVLTAEHRGLEDLMAAADYAMYASKGAGRSRG